MADYSDLLHDPVKRATYVDWKEEAGEILAALRRQWSVKFPGLDAESLDALTENYAAETSDTYLPALGQELSALHLRLYSLDVDADGYALAIIGADDSEAFEAAAKHAAQKISLLSQARRALGTPAKRINLAARVAAQSIPLKSNMIECAGDALILERWSGNCGWLRLTDWAPDEQALGFESHYSAWSETANLYAIVVDAPNGTDGEIRVGQDLADIANWDVIAADAPIHNLVQLAFFDDCLIFARGDSVWIVRDITTGGRTAELYLRAPVRSDFEFIGSATSGDGQRWLRFSDKFYRWDGRNFHGTSLPARLATDFQSTPTDRGFAYVAKDGQLIEVDVETGQERTRALAHLDAKTTVAHLRGPWSVFLRWGEAQTKLDLAQFWNVAEDRWLRLAFGALGKDGLRGLYAPVSGDALWGSNSEKLFHFGEFNLFIEELDRKGKSGFAPSPWSDWTPASPPQSAPVSPPSENHAPAPASPPSPIGRLMGLFRK